MSLSKNKVAVRELLQELEPLILGKKLPEKTCNCGAVCLAPATAIAIESGGDLYPGLEMFWFSWLVRMKPDRGSGWGCTLDFFLDVSTIATIFDRHFPH